MLTPFNFQDELGSEPGPNTPAGPRDGDVQAALVRHKAEPPAGVAPHGAEHHDVRLAPLVGVDGGDRDALK